MLSCCVVNYRTPRLLNDFVESFFTQHFDDSELYVIDVHPTEQTYEETKELLSERSRDDRFRYFPMSYNCGYSGACNFAASIMQGDTFAFFNSDTKLFDDTLEKCYTALNANTDWGILGPLQYASDKKITHGGIFGTNKNPKMRGWRASNITLHRDIREAISVSGSALFVKRDCFEDCANDPKFKQLWPDSEGAFLPTPHYYEETWLCYFARHKGWKVIYYGEAEMIHEWHKSSPVGTVEKEHLATSRKMFRDTCDAFKIERD